MDIQETTSPFIVSINITINFERQHDLERSNNIMIDVKGGICS